MCRTVHPLICSISYVMVEGWVCNGGMVEGWWASIPILLKNAVFLAVIILASSLLVAAAVAGLDMFGIVYVS